MDSAYIHVLVLKVIHVYSMHVQGIIPNDIQYSNFHLPAKRVGVHRCVQR